MDVISINSIFLLILALLPKAYLNCTFLIYLIGVITVVYASISTLRTIDVKELIAYSSVSHAAVYLMGVFSNTIQGIEGGIALGLAHGFAYSGLFICAKGVSYDRSCIRLKKKKRKKKKRNKRFNLGSPSPIINKRWPEGKYIYLHM